MTEQVHPMAMGKRRPTHDAQRVEWLPAHGGPTSGYAVRPPRSAPQNKSFQRDGQNANVQPYTDHAFCQAAVLDSNKTAAQGLMLT
mmetsp:Transcript_49640/g.91639  ORF Transcript_49640/g.91639 Transcript_49640/m.91639 type:complete len:86 (+) Transcript_49640:29-286(+)